MSQSRAKWICCQIGAREHYAVPRALHRHHALAQMLTDSWVRPSSPLGKLKPGLRARFHPELADADVYAPNAANIAFELRAKVAGLRNWSLMIARNDWFQKVIVGRLSRARPAGNSTVLMAYSYAALNMFKLARANGWRTVLAQIDPGPPEERVVTRLYDADPVLGGDWRRPPPQYWSNWREECSLADRIVVNSQWSHAALLEEGIPASKLRIIPLAYHDQHSVGTFQREYPAKFTSDRPLHVLFLGQVNLRKGVGPLLDAIRMLRGEPIRFTFVGAQQISIPADLREHPQICWVGPVPRQETAQFYRDADVLLFPTFSDGFGLTQLEAQAWKLPVLASRFCGDVVQDGRNGILLQEVAAGAIAACLRDWLCKPSSLKMLSVQSGVARRFDLAHVGQQWLDVVD